MSGGFAVGQRVMVLPDNTFDRVMDVCRRQGHPDKDLSFAGHYGFVEFCSHASPGWPGAVRVRLTGRDPAAGFPDPIVMAGIEWHFAPADLEHAD